MFTSFGLWRFHDKLHMSVTRSEINQSLKCIANIRFLNCFLAKLICKILKIRLIRLVSISYASYTIPNSL